MIVFVIMAENKNAIKLSLLLGLASGVGSLGLYYLMARKPASHEGKISSKELRKFATEAEEMQDEADIANLLKELRKELAAMPSELEYCVDEHGKTDYTFTKEFMLKLNYITSKYQIIMQQTIKN